MTHEFRDESTSITLVLLPYNLRRSMCVCVSPVEGGTRKADR